MGLLRVGTILDVDPNLFLNNGFSFGSDSRSESISMVPDPIQMGRPRSGSKTGSN